MASSAVACLLAVLVLQVSATPSTEEGLSSESIQQTNYVVGQGSGANWGYNNDRSFAESNSYGLNNYDAGYVSTSEGQRSIYKFDNSENKYDDPSVFSGTKVTTARGNERDLQYDNRRTSTVNSGSSSESFEDSGIQSNFYGSKIDADKQRTYYDDTGPHNIGTSNNEDRIELFEINREIDDEESYVDDSGAEIDSDYYPTSYSASSDSNSETDTDYFNYTDNSDSDSTTDVTTSTNEDKNADNNVKDYSVSDISTSDDADTNAYDYDNTNIYANGMYTVGHQNTNSKYSGRRDSVLGRGINNRYDGKRDFGERPGGRSTFIQDWRNNKKQSGRGVSEHDKSMDKKQSNEYVRDWDNDKGQSDNKDTVKDSNIDAKSNSDSSENGWNKSNSYSQGTIEDSNIGKSHSTIGYPVESGRINSRYRGDSVGYWNTNRGYSNTRGSEVGWDTKNIYDDTRGFGGRYGGRSSYRQERHNKKRSYRGGPKQDWRIDEKHSGRSGSQEDRRIEKNPINTRSVYTRSGEALSGEGSLNGYNRRRGGRNKFIGGWKINNKHGGRGDYAKGRGGYQKDNDFGFRTNSNKIGFVHDGDNKRHKGRSDFVNYQNINKVGRKSQGINNWQRDQGLKRNLGGTGGFSGSQGSKQRYNNRPGSVRGWGFGYVGGGIDSSRKDLDHGKLRKNTGSISAKNSEHGKGSDAGRSGQVGGSFYRVG